MSETNLFKPPQQPTEFRRKPTEATGMRLFFLVAAALTSTIPLYGFFVLAGRDPQWLALVIFASWLFAWLCGVASLALTFFRPLRKPLAQTASIGLSLYMLLCGLIGWGAVTKTFFELVAG